MADLADLSQVCSNLVSSHTHLGVLILLSSSVSVKAPYKEHRTSKTMTGVRLQLDNSTRRAIMAMRYAPDLRDFYPVYLRVDINVILLKVSSAMCFRIGRLKPERFTVFWRE